MHNMQKMDKEILIDRLKEDQRWCGEELRKLATISEPSPLSQHLQDILFARFDRVTIRLSQLL